MSNVKSEYLQKLLVQAFQEDLDREASSLLAEVKRKFNDSADNIVKNIIMNLARNVIILTREDQLHDRQQVIVQLPFSSDEQVLRQAMADAIAIYDKIPLRQNQPEFSVALDKVRDLLKEKKDE